eukprot:scaffold14473_cov56-Phaeocystis_antarctica.AAC.4
MYLILVPPRVAHVLHAVTDGVMHADRQCTVCTRSTRCTLPSRCAVCSDPPRWPTRSLATTAPSARASTGCSPSSKQQAASSKQQAASCKLQAASSSAASPAYLPPISRLQVGLQRWDPSFEIEELEVVDRGVQRLVDHLGTHEDETLYMYKITRPTGTPGLTAAQNDSGARGRLSGEGANICCRCVEPPHAGSFLSFSPMRAVT